MKKQAYMAPTMLVVKIGLHNMIANSGPQNVYSDPDDGISNEDDILSRGYNGFGDDE